MFTDPLRQHIFLFDIKHIMATSICIRAVPPITSSPFAFLPFFI